MKLYAFSFLFLICSFFKVNAQNLLYEMQPLCGTQKQLSTFFKKNHITDSTVMVFHLKPGSCPRCEGVLTTYAQIVGENARKILLVDGNKTAKEKYILSELKTSWFDNVIYDSLGDFHDFIDYNRTKLDAPYVYKIDINKGDFLNISPILGIKLNADLVKKVLQNKTPIKCIEKTSEKPVSTSYSNAFWDDKIKLENAGTNSFSDVTSIDIEENVFSFLEYGNTNFYIYNWKGNLLHRIAMDTTEFYMYARNEREMKELKQLRDEHVAKVIYLKSILNIKNGDTTVTIAASFPQVEAIDDTDWAYSNRAVKITKGTNGKIIAIDTFPIDLKRDIVITHANYFADDIQGIYTLGILKGWPVIGAVAYNKKDTSNDPFRENFYEESPMIEVFSYENKSLGLFGKLPQLYKRNRTGYYYYDFSTVFFNDKIYFLSNATGEMQVFNISDIKKGRNTSTIFQLLPEKALKPNNKNAKSHEDKLKYLQSFRKDMFDLRISKFDFIKGIPYALIIDKKRSEIKIVKYKENFEENRSIVIPEYNSEIIEHIDLIEKNGNLQLVAIQKEGTNYFLCTKKIINI